MKEFLGTPLIVSAHGQGLDNLTWYIHILMFVLFFGWAGYFLHALIRFRASRQPKADHVGVRNHLSTWVEVGVAVTEGVLLIRSEEHTSELQSQSNLVCRLLLEK